MTSQPVVLREQHLTAQNIPIYCTGIFDVGFYDDWRVNSISRISSPQSLSSQTQSPQPTTEGKSSISTTNTDLIRAKAVFAEPSSFTPEYQVLLRQLRQARKDSGLTQVQLGERLGQPQAIISKCERGERRLDVIELRAYCAALGISYLNFLAQVELLISNDISP